MGDALQDKLLDAATAAAELGEADDRYMKILKMALSTCREELICQLELTDRVSLCIPINTDVDGKVNSGALLLTEDRAILTWLEGSFRVRTRSAVTQLTDISDVTVFTRKIGRVSAQLDAISYRVSQRRFELIFYSDISHPRLVATVGGILNGSATPPGKEA